MVAIREGLEASATVRFIDLTFPEKVEAHQFERAEGAALRRRSQSMQDEAWFSHSRLLRAACVRTGSRDPDDLWDHLYEVDYRSVDTAEFMRGVLAYCALARRTLPRKRCRPTAAWHENRRWPPLSPRSGDERSWSPAASTPSPCRRPRRPCPNR